MTFRYLMVTALAMGLVNCSHNKTTSPGRKISSEATEALEGTSIQYVDEASKCKSIENNVIASGVDKGKSVKDYKKVRKFTKDGRTYVGVLLSITQSGSPFSAKEKEKIAQSFSDEIKNLTCVKKVEQAEPPSNVAWKDEKRITDNPNTFIYSSPRYNSFFVTVYVDAKYADYLHNHFRTLPMDQRSGNNKSQFVKTLNEVKGGNYAAMSSPLLLSGM